MDFVNSVHGGNLEKAKLLFPHVKVSWLDLSTGINPYSYPISCKIDPMLQALPNLAYEEQLRKIAAIYYGCKDLHSVAVAPGSQILISLLPYLLQGKEVCIYCPIYMEHIFAWKHVGVNPHEVFTLDEFIEFSKKPNRIGILCNPNNPDGRSFDQRQLASMIQHWKAFGNQLIIDEAFMDFEGQGAASFLSDGGLIILRSFGKTYGLAGIRLGFMLSDTVTVQKIRQMLGPWAVNGLAVQIGIQALQDKIWLEQTRVALRKQEADFEYLCKKTGLKIIGGTTLFKLIYCEQAQNLWSYLANNGIWVRKFDYNDVWLRFGMLCRKEDWKRLEKSVCDYFQLKNL